MQSSSLKNSYREEKDMSLDQYSISYQKEKVNNPLSTFIQCMNDLNMQRH